MLIISGGARIIRMWRNSSRRLACICLRMLSRGLKGIHPTSPTQAVYTPWPLTKVRVRTLSSDVQFPPPSVGDRLYDRSKRLLFPLERTKSSANNSRHPSESTDLG